MPRPRLALALGVAVLVALLVLVGPGLVVRPLVARRAAVVLGTPVHVGWMWWNPFTATWTARDVRADADRGPAALRARRIAAVIRLTDVLRGRSTVRRLSLVGARARLRAGAPGWELPLPAVPGPPPTPTPWPTFLLVQGEARPLTLRLEPRGARPSTVRLRRVALAGVDVAPGRVQASGTLRGRLDRGAIAVAASFRRTESAERLRARVGTTALDVARTIRLLPAGSVEPHVAGLLDARATYEAVLHRGHGHHRAGGRLTLRDPRIGDAAAPGLKAARLAVDRIEADLDAGTLRLGRVEAVGPEAWVARTAEGLRIAGVLEPSHPAAASPWQVTWDGIVATGGTVHYAGGDRGAELVLDRVELGATDRPGAPVRASVTGRLGSGGDVAARGTLATAPAGFTGDVSLAHVALPPLAALAGTPVALESGEAGAELSVATAADGPSASGTFRVDDVKTRPPDGGRPEDVLAFKAAHGTIRRVALAPFALALDWVVVEWPYVLADRGGDGIFPLTIVPAATAADGAALPPVTVRTASVEGGRIDFRDLTMTPPYWRSLASFALTLDGVRTPPLAVARVRGRGLIDELSPLRIQGTIGPKTRLTADVEHVSLPPFNAYLAPVIDYLVSSGALTAHSEITLERSQLEVDNRIVVSRLGLGSGSENDLAKREVGIPLTLAIALMKDYHGDIALDLPFRGDLAAATFSVGDIVRQALARAIRGAVLAPLNALGRVFLRDGRIERWSLEPIPFPPGSRELDAAGRARVVQVARVLRLHAELAVTVRGQVAAPDVDAIQATHALATLGNGSGDERIRDALAARAAGREPPALDPPARTRLDALVGSLPWPADELRRLADERALATVSALVAEPGIAAARVHAAEAAAPPPGSLADGPGAALDVGPA